MRGEGKGGKSGERRGGEEREREGRGGEEKEQGNGGEGEEERAGEKKTAFPVSPSFLLGAASLLRFLPLLWPLQARGPASFQVILSPLSISPKDS